MKPELEDIKKEIKEIRKIVDDIKKIIISPNYNGMVEYGEPYQVGRARKLITVSLKKEDENEEV
tara:strand:- start:810 stop:1001 length:192 start_codon:yes stop_codon:yes gene_type:complete